MNYQQAIPVIFEEIVSNVRTNILADLQAYDDSILTLQYWYGSWKEISNMMAIYNNNPTGKHEKFPIVILLEDITVERGRTSYQGVTRGMQIVIANYTDPTLTSKEREEQNFSNILRPIYYELLKQIYKSPAVSVYSQRLIQHRYIERKYWGMDDGASNALLDYIDAIHLENIEININWAYCQETITQNI